MQQDQSKTTGNLQEPENKTTQEENQNAPVGNRDALLVPQQGEIKNNDHDPGAGPDLSISEAENA